MASRATANVDGCSAGRLGEAEEAVGFGRSSRAGREPIAVIGMACRFPKAPDLEALWRLLRDGVDAITEMPRERFDVDSLYSPDPSIPGKMITKWGGFLEHVDRFDAAFFNISPMEASRVDPQQRLMLELSWEALEDAGVAPHSLKDSLTGVFFGAGWHDYDSLSANPMTAITSHTATGQNLSAIAGRVSYTLGLRGPSILLNTACSSSLVAVHYARRSLQLAECSLALAGGVNLLLSPENTVVMSKLRALSPDGRSRPFDSRANGYVRSEGGAVVVLKPLAQAQADGDPIHCVLLGSAVNNNGDGQSLAATSVPAQAELLRRAYADAGVSPHAVQYVEAHGTGTRQGDPTEAEALGVTLGVGRPEQQPLLIGSLKGNLGHLETAAGVAGLIKVALALKHQQIPPNLHFQSPNPKIPFDSLRLRVPTELLPWPRTRERAIAGVSAFSFSGTNCHVVVAQAESTGTTPPAAADSPALLLPLSAHTPAALQQRADAMCRFLSENDSLPAADIAHTAGARRSHLTHRLAVVGSTKAQWLAQLQAFVKGQEQTGLWRGSAAGAPARRLVFVYPGQGGQWLAMGKQLLEESPVFRQTIEQCDGALRPYCDWSLLEVLAGRGSEAALERVDVVQPAIFAMQVGLSAVLRGWGVEPAAVVGHSLGEVAAAQVAGWLSLEEACRVICQRSKLVRQTSGQGAMAVVELPAPEVREELRAYAGQVDIGAVNGPRTTVVSGERQAVQEVIRRLEQTGVYCRLIKVDYASHSPQMDGLAGALRQELAGVIGATGAVPLYSTVTGKRNQDRLGAEYWQRNLRQTVQFCAAAQELGKDGYDTYVEISPHPVLLPALQEALRESVPHVLAVGSLRRDHGGTDALLNALGALYVRGVALDWSRLPPAGGRLVALPSYPFQRTRHWVEAPAHGARSPRAAGSHPLLGPPLQLSTQPGVRIFELELDLEQLPYLRDHRVQDAVVLPAAAYLEMARAAAHHVFKAAPGTIEAVTLQEMLSWASEPSRTVQLVVQEEGPGRLRFELASRKESDGSWRCHCRGRLGLAAAAATHAGDGLAALRARCEERLAPGPFYAGLATRGLPYGPAFQRVTELYRHRPEAPPETAPETTPEALGKVQLDPPQLGAYGLHPALLDGCLQVMMATLGESAAGPAVPIAIEAVRLHRPLTATVWSHVRLRPAPASTPRRPKADLRILGEDGEPLAELIGVELQVLGSAASARAERYLQLAWRAAALPAPQKPTRPPRFLLLADAGGAAAALRPLLQARGAAVELLPAGTAAALDRLLKDKPCTAVVHLTSLDAPTGQRTTPTALEESRERDCGGVLEVLHALARLALRDPPRLWLITRGVHALGGAAGPLAPAGAMLWGLGRTIAYEHPELACTRLDLSPAPFPGELAALADELLGADPEDEVALREDGRSVARLSWQPAAPPAEVLVPAAGQCFRLEIATPGILDGLKLRPLLRRPPGPGEVELAVAAASLNFLDVLMAMGIYPGQAAGPILLGRECSGTVVRVGAGVSELAPGDAVVALAPGAFASHVTVPARLVVRRPPSLPAAEAAAVALTLMTAYYGLHTLARLKEGERVLIHSAAGGTGLAAVQLAQRAGAEVFATAGSAEKREYLRGLGVRHVMDSRSLDFAAEIRAITAGRGVDVVLNSLTGAAIPQSLSVLAPYGRFVELGKRDIYDDAPLGLGHFRKKLSYFAVDLAGLLEDRPEEAAQLFRQVMQHVSQGSLAPPPVRVFPLAEAQAAFRLMAQGTHRGKLVLAMAGEGAHIAVPAAQKASLRSDATYLLTGGLGGLGLALARWMGEQGARNLALLGRSGALSAEQQAAVAALEAAGVRVAVMRGDVARPAELAAALDCIATTMPPLRGVIHAAGLLADGLLVQQSLRQFAEVMAPKVLGAWNLHALTQALELDFFVLYSSAAALLGSPGQGNYAAANGFLDALAHYRRSVGLPALSINWGTFTDVGLAAAQDNRGQRLAARGMTGLSAVAGHAALARLLPSPSAQVGVVDLDVRQWVEFHPQVAVCRLLQEVLKESPRATDKTAAARVLAERLRAASPAERRTLLERHLREQLGHVVRMSAEQIDVTTPFKSLGVDSLMGLELRNRLESGLGLTLSAALIWTYPDIARLAAHLAGRFAEAAAKAEDPAAPAEAPEATAELDSLSDSELVRLGDALLD